MNLELNEVMALIDKVKDTGIYAFEYEDESMKVKIKGSVEEKERVPEEKAKSSGLERKQKTAYKEEQMTVCKEERELDGREEPSVLEGKENSLYVTSPLVGTFYHAPAEGADPFVSVGDFVKKGQVIGIVEAMKLMNEIQSEVDGTVEEILVPNETLVEFGQNLIRMKGC